MDENLVGYLLDSLDDRGRSEVEAYLQRNPQAREQLARLRHALAPLEADRDPVEVPHYLAERTLVRVAEHICAEGPEDDLPHAPVLKFETPGSTRPWWRRMDVLVAACLLVTATGLVLPGIQALRTSAGGSPMLACQNNLKQFFGALETYRDVHHRYPNVEAEAPRNVAGMVVPILADAGVLPSDASVRCPGNGEPLGCPTTLAALRSMNDEEFDTKAPLLSHSYAYSLGYRDEAGSYHGPDAGSCPMSRSRVPIMGDRPPAEGVLSNSINHDGQGQNVLYSDGHVTFCTSRAPIANDDLYLNLKNQVAAGLGASDFVLGCSASRP